MWAAERDGVEQVVDPHPVVGDSRRQRGRPDQAHDGQVQPAVGRPVVRYCGGLLQGNRGLELGHRGVVLGAASSELRGPGSRTTRISSASVISALLARAICLAFRRSRRHS
jgi:hypothetical protein